MTAVLFPAQVKLETIDVWEISHKFHFLFLHRLEGWNLLNQITSLEKHSFCRLLTSWYYITGFSSIRSSLNEIYILQKHSVHSVTSYSLVCSTLKKCNWIRISVRKGQDSPAELAYYFFYFSHEDCVTHVIFLLYFSGSS